MHRDEITGMQLACKTRLFLTQEKMHKSSLYVTLIYFVAKPA
jgi:hypothetical protein